MIIEKKQGLWLTRKDASGAGKEGWMLQTAVSLLACLAQVLLVAELAGAHHALVMGFAGGYLCILYGVLTRLGKQKWFFPGVLLAMAGLVFLFHGQVLAGFCQFHHRLGQTLTRGTGWVLPELEAPAATEAVAGGLFALLCGAAMALLSCFFVVVSPQVLAILLPGAAVAGLWLLGQEQEPECLIPVLGISMALLLYGGWSGETAPAPKLMGWGACGLLFLGMVLVPSGGAELGKAVSEQVRQAIHAYRYETEYTVLPEGDFRQAPAPSTDGLPGLLVTMSHPGEMYLRGFAGCTFSGEAWKPMDAACLAENAELLYWLNQGDFPLNAQFSAASGLLGQETGTVAIENIGACSENLYLPLGLAAGDWLEPENLNQDVLSGNGSRVYRYNVVEMNENTISRVLEYLQTSEEPQVLQYRREESAYRDFIYDNYTQVPETVTEMLGPRWDAIAEVYSTVDDLTLHQAQECALVFLESCFSESRDEDQALPLSNAQGSSYQYATVAVLTLRYFGIPARYAEGYVISEEMAAGVSAGEPVEVTAACAGAWPEVYQDGIGWIPMTLAPGFGELLREEPNAQGTAQEQEEPQQTESLPQEQPEPVGGTVTALTGNDWFPVVVILAVLALFCLILAGRRQLLCRKKQEKFRQELGNAAIGWLFADVATLLEAVGLNRGNGSMRQLCGPAKERFGAEYAEKLSAMIRCNEESLFSSRTMTAQQWQDMVAFHQKTVECLQTGSKWHRRLWMKWIRCLY